MKILIVGGGWVGCHLAYKLMNEYDVTIFDKNKHLFLETSNNNQNRLHMGYHYPRSFETREMCKNTFDLFIEDYSFLTEIVEKNIYSIPLNNSLIDFQTYLKIFNDMDHILYENVLSGVEGSILVKERYINSELAKEFFNRELNKLKVQKRLSILDLHNTSNDYDLVINCTNNQLKECKDSFYELTITLIYEKLRKTNFEAITLVDGDFFSIYKYKENLYTLTDAEHTPIKKFDSYIEVEKFKETINNELIEDKRKLMENKVLQYYNQFLNDFKYRYYFLSVKSKFKSSSQSRYPIITKNNNIISCFTGKIQGIYVIEKYIKDEINNRI